MLTSQVIPDGPLPNSSFEAGLMSKSSNPVYRHLISSMGLSPKIGILLFSEEHLLIMG